MLRLRRPFGADPASVREYQVLSASDAKLGMSDRPAWLDQVLGCLSPPFSFRNGGSAITGNVKRPTQQSAAVTSREQPGRPKSGQRV